MACATPAGWGSAEADPQFSGVVAVDTPEKISTIALTASSWHGTTGQERSPANGSIMSALEITRWGTVFAAAFSCVAAVYMLKGTRRDTQAHMVFIAFWSGVFALAGSAALRGWIDSFPLTIELLNLGATFVILGWSFLALRINKRIQAERSWQRS